MKKYHDVIARFRVKVTDELERGLAVFFYSNIIKRES
jgi:hypothetical protein